MADITPIVCFCFDVYDTTETTVLPLFQERGFTGTQYFDYNNPVATGSTTAEQLAILAAAGFEVAAYMIPNPGINMITLYNSLGAAGVIAEFQLAKSSMAALGYDVKSFAPTQRAWTQTMADLARPYFENCRCVQAFGPFAQFPVSDPFYELNGGSPALSFNDTADALIAMTDSLIRTPGGLWVPVTHHVAAPADDYAVDPDVVTPWYDYIAAQVQAGDLRVMNFSDAMRVRQDDANLNSRAFDHLAFDEDTFDAEFWNDITEQRETWTDIGH